MGLSSVTNCPGFGQDIALKKVVASGHHKIWLRPAANRGFSDFKNVVAFSRNQNVVLVYPNGKLRLIIPLQRHHGIPGGKHNVNQVIILPTHVHINSRQT